MSDAAFTPGPWSLDDTRYREGYGTRRNIKDANGSVVLSVPSDDVFATTLANANLIASAPDMFAALVAARAIIVEDAMACRAFRHESEGPSGPENVLAKIDDVLAKARGGEVS